MARHSPQGDTEATACLRQKPYRIRFLVTTKNGFKNFSAAEVTFFCFEMKMTIARLAGGQVEIIQQSLDVLQQELDPKYFFRANRQHIIQVDSIVSIHNYFGSKLKVGLKDGTNVIISKEKAPHFKLWLGY